MDDRRTLHRTLDLCLKVGEVLLSSGAGAPDVVATMRALARALGVRHTQVDVTFTSLAMSVQQGPDEAPVVQLRAVTQREIDYEHLTLVDHMVRAVVAGESDLESARTQLAQIVSSGHARPRWAATLAWGVMCGGVGLQLGGNLVVVLVAMLAAICIDRLQLTMTRRRLPGFYQQVAGGVVATVLAALGTRLAEPWVHLNASLVVTANIIMLLAGIGFMGAVQDALSGFFVTGGARILEAVLATAGIIAGVSGGLALCAAVGLEIPTLTLPRFDLVGVTTVGVGGAIGAAAFAFASYAPLRTLLPVGILGGLSLAATELMSEAGAGRTFAVGLSAFAIGLFGYTVGRRFRVPPLVVVVSAVVPLLPGLSIYRGLFLLGEEGGQQAAQGLLAMVTAASVAIALASGVILGEYVAQPVMREARRVEARLAGPRLVGVTRARRRARSRPAERRE
ncbi:threonine/serine ThrE exporter family protein [Nocardioides daeguensis]|uniref:Threonine/serine exporter family protein n=1 Tax=Nocardioides daeguensis TaxID=908359 RepID=A0ABP6VES7_9ACTN|nr:threonine/serine exporter family protein [Nocardioides daeguensis]MBV6729386.1 threonine/serine exporter family protein [Nocardioides daeguensis]MCR1771841.1 threonine/serine exporter family protein [Nocardioides daeguensis]